LGTSGDQESIDHTGRPPGTLFAVTPMVRARRSSLSVSFDERDPKVTKIAVFELASRNEESTIPFPIRNGPAMPTGNAKSVC